MENSKIPTIKNDKPSILNQNETTFFKNHFDSISFEKASLKKSELHYYSSQINETGRFKMASYRTNIGFHGELYKIPLQHEDNQDFLGVIKVDENIWGSYYSLIVFSKIKENYEIISQVDMNHTFDSLNIVQNDLNPEIYNINVFFENDLTSAYSGAGIHFWQLKDNQLIKWRTDSLNLQLE